MGLLELFILAVGLSMDAFTVSVCKGLSVPRAGAGECCIAGVWFGGFQALMPLLGYLLGSRFKNYITSVDHWIAFVLLLIIGVICTMVVIFLFFGNVRASLIVGMSMPLSILLAMICMSYAGFNLDLMTGAGLIIAIGMIVDNSIVVMEACMRYRSEELTPKEAAVQGTPP